VSIAQHSLTLALSVSSSGRIICSLFSVDAFFISFPYSFVFPEALDNAVTEVLHPVSAPSPVPFMGECNNCRARQGQL
jgi:hypothetical protein